MDPYFFHVPWSSDEFRERKIPSKEVLAFGVVGWGSTERELPLVSGGVLSCPPPPPAAVPLVSMARGITALYLGQFPTWGAGFHGSLGSSDLGEEEGWGTRQWT